VETRLKERLVGAAVLVAAAFILIPEMLSGPHPQDAPAAAQTDGAVRSFSIDLSKSPAHPDTINAIPAAGETHQPDPNQAPPPEMPATTAAPAATETTATPPPEVKSEIIDNTPAPPAEKPPATAPKITPAEKPSPPPSAKPIEKEKPAAHAAEKTSGDHQWAVQVGSFGNDPTAQKVAQGFKQKGYAAFVMPFKKDGKTLYRVRIGPQSQRSAADAVFAKLKGEGVTNLAVVAHP
jgi:DedD protein